VTPNEFQKIRDDLGMTNAEIARLLRVSGPRTVQKWLTGERTIYAPVALLLKILHECPTARDIARK